MWYGHFLEGVDDSYDRHFNLNLRPVIELSKDAARRIVSCGWGRIINIGSIYGEAVRVPNISIFTATKSAVHGFTRALSRELGATGVTVNSVQPGFIFTELSTADGHEVMKRRTSVGHYGSYELKRWRDTMQITKHSLFHRRAMSSVVGRTTDRKGETRTFSVDGQETKLTLFSEPHGFFLPFADALAGKATYGAGRYVEPKQLPNGRLLVDFNYAYNPYCAYNKLFSCPLTPIENGLKVPIRAGEKLPIGDWLEHEQP